MLDLVGQTVSAVDDDEISDEELDSVMIQEAVSSYMLSTALTRFMPPLTAVLFQEDELKGILDDFGLDIEGYEDEITDLVLTHYYDGDEQGIIAVELNDFLDQLFEPSDSQRSYVKDVLYSGKVVQYGIQTEDEENDDE